MRVRLTHWAAIAVAVAAVCAFSAPAFAQDATYIGADACKVCHNKKDTGEQYNKWKAEAHAKAFENLKTDKAKEVATKAGITKPPSEAPECLKCHATAFDAASAKTPEKINPALGVQCEACHGPASLHQKEGMKALKKDPTAKTAETQTKPDVKTCEKCHNKDNPTYNPERYTLKDGTKADFDFEQAWAKIAHPNPAKEKK
ncbi:MAG: hypothetical protein HUU46_14160 [Candidatus Hydrogenedentes bacterium]|nr:hypothetical protein [Candidatus Hydrogenedentota bacterium]